MASAAAPVYYCDSSYFLFGGLGERKKKSKVGAGELGSGEPESGAPEGTGVHRGCHLLPRDAEGARCASPGKETVYCNFGVSGRAERVHPVVG